MGDIIAGPLGVTLSQTTDSGYLGDAIATRDVSDARRSVPSLLRNALPMRATVGLRRYSERRLRHGPTALPWIPRP